MLFNILYLVCIVGFHCKGCVLEREYVKTQATEDWRDFSGSSWLSIPQKEACALHMTGMWRVRLDGDSCVFEYLEGKAFPRNTRETFCFASLSSLIHTFSVYTIYTHITHKWKESFWEKTLTEQLKS